jgi:adenylate cyclase
MDARGPINSPARLWKGWAVVLSAGIVLGFSPVSEWLELKWLDIQFSLLRSVSPKRTSSNIVIVGIDDATFGAFPEPMALWHTRLAAILKGIGSAKPLAVGVDLDLPQRSYDFIRPDMDLELFESLRQLRVRVPLVVARSVDSSGRVRPIHLPFLAAVGSENTGLAVFPIDDDGMVRRFDEALGEHDLSVPTLVGVLARQLGKTANAGLIDFALGPPFRYIPVQIVWAWAHGRDSGRLRDAFEGSIVLLGSVLPFEDRHRIPVGLAAWEEDARAPGVLVHAQTLRSLLGPGLVRPAAAGWSIALTLLGSFLWFAFFRLAPGVIAAFLFIGCLAALSLGLLHAGVHLSVANAALMAFLASVARIGHEARHQYREQIRLKGAFEGYVSPGVLELILNGKLNSELGSGRRAVCVLFADIRDFTVFSERTPPEDAVALLNRYFERMTPIIHSHDGTVDNFRGDGIMCMFGAPLPCPDPCRAGFLAAREMLDALATLNAELRAEGRPPISIGIGLGFGEAVVGRLGAANRHVYSAIGDVANVSARLEGLTKDIGYPLVVSAVVANTVGDETRFDDLGMQALKGHTPVHAFGWPARAN